MTNFFISYIDEVKPYPENTIYGHGREQYDRVIDFMDKYENHYTEKIAWKALISVVQDPGDNITSNTQWSVMYDMTDKKLKIVFRRHFEENWCYTQRKNIKH
jgi:hypothetical protein